jgi:hypothetical protein
MVEVNGRLLLLTLATSTLVGCGETAASRARAAADSAAAAESAAAAKPALAPGKMRVTVVMIGKRIGANNLIIEPTFQFAPSDTVYLSVGTEGTPETAKLSTKWVSQKGEVVDSSAQEIHPKGPENTAFKVARPKGWAVGVYKVTIFADGDSVDAKTFAVKK